MDSYGECEGWAESGYCSHSYVSWMSVHCRCSCDVCECGDVYPDDCPDWQSYGYCEETYVEFMREYCRGSCGLCDA